MTEPRTDAQETPSSSSSGTPDDENERVDSYFEPEDLTDALPITSPAPEAVGDAPRYSRKVGEGDAERFFPARTGEEAEASLEAIAAFCGNCPIWHQCPEDGCAVHRAEAKALEVANAAYYAGVKLSGGVQP